MAKIPLNLIKNSKINNYARLVRHEPFYMSIYISNSIYMKIRCTVCAYVHCVKLE